MAHLPNSEQQHPQTPDRFSQWASLRDIVSLIAKENTQSEQQIAAILVTSDLMTLRPILHDDILIRGDGDKAIEDHVRYLLTPVDERKHAFGSDTNWEADSNAILFTIPVVTEWLSTHYPRLILPTPWVKWLRVDFPTLYQASQTITASGSASLDPGALSKMNGNQQVVTLKDAPAYLGITKYKFNKEVRANLREVRIAERGVGFMQADLESWSHQLSSNVSNRISATKKSEKNPNGLFQRGSIWHIDKVIGGQRICKTTGSKDYATAERVLAKLIGETYQAQSFGTRPDRTFSNAAAYYLEANGQKKSLSDDRRHIERLLTYGDLANTPIVKIHRGLFDDFVEQRQKEGVTNATINHALKVVRQMLNQAANDWRDEHGLTWLEIAPKIKLVPDNDKRTPRVLTWPEQSNFFALLPDHLRAMAAFAVNTGCRESEICSLSWTWEKKVLNTSVFVLPKVNAKNGRSRVIVPNRIARDCIESQRGKHPERVFTFRGKPVEKLNNSGWKTACKAAGLYNSKTGLRVHDLRHTAATRLRHAGVDEETRREILGHSSGRSMTNHYSAASLRHLINSVELLCPNDDGSLLFDDIVLRL